jgi:hypothetical protein
MRDYLTSLVERVLERAPVIRPLRPPLFAGSPPEVGSDLGSLHAAELERGEPGDRRVAAPPPIRTTRDVMVAPPQPEQPAARIRPAAPGRPPTRPVNPVPSEDDDGARPQQTVAPRRPERERYDDEVDDGRPMADGLTRRPGTSEGGAPDRSRWRDEVPGKGESEALLQRLVERLWTPAGERPVGEPSAHEAAGGRDGADPAAARAGMAPDVGGADPSGPPRPTSDEPAAPPAVERREPPARVLEPRPETARPLPWIADLPPLEPALPQPAPAPTIQVTIGRIDVRVASPAPSARTRKPAEPTLSLEAYLRQREGGKEAAR